MSYYNGSSYTFTWNGRKLATAIKGTDTMSFAYNNSGLRISKTVNGVTTHYVYDGDILLAEYTDNETIVYIYDANDSPIGFKYRVSSYEADVWDVYWYGKNLQGDVLYVYNASGTKLITYTYTAWGKTTITYSNGGASTTAINNNLTYRGYYYDSDLDLYYLQTRYYDPVIGRFINADEYVSTGQKLIGNNMFAYCNNNPVMLLDSMGEKAMPFWELIWPGEIHREIQEYLRDKHHYKTEVTVEGKRIDLVKDNNAYEIKPFSTPSFVALLQLLYYIELSDGKYVLGVYSPELTGSFVSKRGFQVKFYYMGCGIIQYSFYRETSPVEILVPEKDRSQSTGGSVAGAVATVVTTGVAVCFVGFVGYGGLIPPCKEMKTLTAVAY